MLLVTVTWMFLLNFLLEWLWEKVPTPLLVLLDLCASMVPLAGVQRCESGVRAQSQTRPLAMENWPFWVIICFRNTIIY